LKFVVFVLNGRFLQIASSSGVVWSVIMAMVGGVSMVSVMYLCMSSIFCVCIVAFLWGSCCIRVERVSASFLLVSGCW